MLSLRVSRDKRGYDLIYLIWDQRRRGRPEPRLLYCCRLPAPLRVGPPPFDDEVRARLEEAHPEIPFDWTALLKSLLGAINSNARAAAGPIPPTFKTRRSASASAPGAPWPSNQGAGPRDRAGMRGEPQHVGASGESQRDRAGMRGERPPDAYREGRDGRENNGHRGPSSRHEPSSLPLAARAPEPAQAYDPSHEPVWPGTTDSFETTIVSVEVSVTSDADADSERASGQPSISENGRSFDHGEASPEENGFVSIVSATSHAVSAIAVAGDVASERVVAVGGAGGAAAGRTAFGSQVPGGPTGNGSTVGDGTPGDAASLNRPRRRRRRRGGRPRDPMSANHRDNAAGPDSSGPSDGSDTD